MPGVHSLAFLGRDRLAAGSLGLDEMRVWRLGSRVVP